MLLLDDFEVAHDLRQAGQVVAVEDGETANVLLVARAAAASGFEVGHGVR